MRAKVSGWSSAGAAGGAERRGRLAVGDARGRAAEHVADLRPRRARRAARCGRAGAGRPAAGRTGSRRRTGPGSGEMRAKMSRRSITLQTEVSKKTPGAPARSLRERREVGDARVGDDQRGVRDRRRRGCRRWSAIGGRPRPPWIRIGTRRSAASAKTGSSRSSSSRKPCARGWSLIPRAPRSRQRVASSIGLLGEVEPDERDEQAVRALGGRERAVVGRAEGGLAVGLVEAERERPLDPVPARGTPSARRAARRTRRCRGRRGRARRRARRRPARGRRARRRSGRPARRARSRTVLHGA